MPERSEPIQVIVPPDEPEAEDRETMISDFIKDWVARVEGIGTVNREFLRISKENGPGLIYYQFLSGIEGAEDDVKITYVKLTGVVDEEIRDIISRVNREEEFALAVEVHDPETEKYHTIHAIVPRFRPEVLFKRSMILFGGDVDTTGMEDSLECRKCGAERRRLTDEDFERLQADGDLQRETSCECCDEVSQVGPDGYHGHQCSRCETIYLTKKSAQTMVHTPAQDPDQDPAQDPAQDPGQDPAQDSDETH